jgi:zinc protease
VGGSLSASSGQDFFSVSAVTLTDHVDRGFELLLDVVRNATFPDDELELARRQTLSALQAELGQPQTIANRRFGSLVYGDGHPYGVSPTPETVQSVTREDLAAFRDAVLRPDGALLFVAGRVERAEVESIVRERFGDWEGGPGEDAAFPVPPERDETRVYLFHRPGSVQTVIRVGHLGVEAGHPDYFPLEVLNSVLGGGADTPLFRIRSEEKGWTYCAFSG